MKIYFWTLLPWLCTFVFPASSNAKNLEADTCRFTTIAIIERHIHIFAAVKDSIQRSKDFSSLYEKLKNQGSVPFVSGDTALFLYYGPAKTVSWAGDFNGWDPNSEGYS